MTQYFSLSIIDILCNYLHPYHELLGSFLEKKNLFSICGVFFVKSVLLFSGIVSPIRIKMLLRRSCHKSMTDLSIIAPIVLKHFYWQLICTFFSDDIYTYCKNSSSSISDEPMIDYNRSSVRKGFDFDPKIWHRL